MPKEPRLSVVSIAYNHRDGLRRTLESVEQQVWGNIEIIVVDGASSDGTAAFLRDHRSRHRFDFVSERDHGIYDAMNKGLARATGDLVVFMNAGDCFSNSAVGRMVSQSYMAEGWHWGYGCARVMHGDIPQAILQFVPFRFDRLALGLATVPHQAAVMERTFIEAMGGFDSKIGLAADQELLFKAACHAPPRLWGEFFADFEGGGQGSGRRPAAYAREMRAARQRQGVRIGKSRWADAALTSGVVATQYALRWQAAIRSRAGLRPPPG